MPAPRTSSGSDEPGPRSSSPVVVSAAAKEAPASARLPLGIAGIGLCGVIGFMLARLTLPPEEAAIECVQAALAAKGSSSVDSSLDAEIVLSGKLEAGGKRAAEIAKGPLSDPVRLETIEACRAMYAEQKGLSAASPLLRVESGVASVLVQRTLERPGEPRVPHPAPGAQVSVDNLPEVGSCVTSSSGQCELALRDLAHDAKLEVTAQLPSGVVVSQATSVLELLRHGLTLQARDRTVEDAPDCLAAGRRVQDEAQYTKVPAEAAGHELRAWVEVMSSGIVSDVQPARGSDSQAMSALRLQLAGLRGLPGPCDHLRVSLHY